MKVVFIFDDSNRFESHCIIDVFFSALVIKKFGSKVKDV